MEIVIGSWGVPALISFIAYAWAFFTVKEDNRGGGGYYDFSAIGALFIYGFATIISLVVWLIWALVTIWIG